MDIGDSFRSFTERSDAVALLGIRDLVDRRQNRDVNAERGWAYSISSLMHPEEVETMRQVCGTQLFVISAASPQDTRLERLATDISRSTGMDIDECKPIAMDLMIRDAGPLPEDPTISLHKEVARDEQYPAKPGSHVDVGNTFEMADVFVSPDQRAKSQRTLERFLDLVFSHPFHTPTVDEMGMYSAYGFALGSASLSRRVGAVITTRNGDVVSAGANDVPKFGGGLYWAEETPDHRDFQLGYDSNDVIKRELLMDMLIRLQRVGWLQKNFADLSAEALIKRALLDETIRAGRILDVIEYGRAVHAEMAALTDAARRGVSSQDCTLYSTTFPCHECARHIVAAGIKRVVYIEAYPKSRVAELYRDSIGLAAQAAEVGQRVSFEPFVGIGPRRFGDLFSFVPRKNPNKEDTNMLKGSVVDWDVAAAPVRPTIINSVREYGQAQLNAIRTAQERASDLSESMVGKYRAAEHSK